MEAYSDKSFWHSKIKDFQTCPAFYKLKHIDKADIPDDKTADLHFGSAMHLGIEDVLGGNDGIELFRFYMSTIKDRDIEYGRLGYEQLIDCGEILLTRFKRLHVKNFDPFQVETRIYGKFKEHGFEGTPDFLGSYKGVPSVVDWKTAGYRYDKRKIVCDEQMPSYAELAKQVFNYTAEQLVYVVFIKDRNNPSIQIIQKNLHDNVRQATVENVAAVIEDIKSKKAFPRNTSSCIRGSMVCPAFSLCYPEGGEANE